MRSKLALIMGALVVGSLVPAAATAQNSQSRWEGQVQQYLRRAARVLEERGYAETHDRFMDNLNENRSTSIRITLRADQVYSIVGVCDNDCTDLDFKLYDDEDNLIDEDLQTDDTPIVSVTPRRTGSFRLVVKMVTCSNEPCYFGVGVWRRD